MIVREAVEQAWMDLERMVDRGFAVAFRKDGRHFHVRAVFDEKVTESSAETMSEAVLVVSDKVDQTRTRSKK